jgi:hypothetical protein
MLQRPNGRQNSTAPIHGAASSQGPEIWGKWINDKSAISLIDRPLRSENQGRFCFDRHYSLEVLQHPMRARMCGFGDKVRKSFTIFLAKLVSPGESCQDRRPLAPAAVARMVVRRDDNTVVDVK